MSTFPVSPKINQYGIIAVGVGIGIAIGIEAY
jgi:hypothetical protein